MVVKTTIKTLEKFQRMLNELGVGKINDTTKDTEINLMDISNKLLTDGLLVEFLQEITGDKETDWENEPLTQIKAVLESFFSDIIGLLPKSTLDFLKAMYLQNLRK